MPEFDEYTHYKFDLDQLMESAALSDVGTLYVNFHRLEFWSTDVTVFDNIQIYAEAGGDRLRPIVAYCDPMALVPQSLSSARVRFNRATKEIGRMMGAERSRRARR